MNIYDLLVVQPIFNLLTAIYALIPGGDFGVTIIIFTIIMRFLMYPLLKKQLHQTRLMRKLQPKLKQIKKDARGNRQLEAMQMMELYKRHGVSPFRSIALLLIQLPIFLGLYHAIQIYTLHRDQIEKYTYNFLESIGPIRALIEHPDSFNQKLLGFIDLTKHAIGQNGVETTLIVLAILSAITQYILSKQTMPQDSPKKSFRQIMAEAADGKQADQAEMNALVMQNMVKFMPIMMFFIMMSLPGAIAFYYTISNLVAVAQQAYLLRKDEEELEEIAEEVTPAKKKSQKTPITSTREKNAKNARVTRITAKDKGRKKGKKSL